MKLRPKLIIPTTLALLGGCQDTTFKSGECIQKPDSMEILQIESISAKKARTKVVMPQISSADSALIRRREIELNGDWIITSCPHSKESR